MHGLRSCAGGAMAAMVLCCMLSFAACAGYGCPPDTPGWPCLRDPDGSPMTVRVMFMDSQFVTTNPTAVSKAALLGTSYSCDDVKLAIPECFVFENWSGGWVGAYMQQALRDMGVNVIALTKANFSAEVKRLYKGPSSFTRCAWEVRLGNVDLCVGDFWETPERRNITAFTSPIDSDTFHLFTRSVPNPAKKFNIESLLTIFHPFSNAVWLCMGFMFSFCAFSIWITENGHNEEFERTPMGVISAVYHSTMAFVGGDVPATVWPTRIVSLGFMIFIFIHVTSYTASLASTLVTTQVQIGEVTSLQDLIRKGKRLCVYQSMAAATSDIIGNVVQLVQMDNYGPMLEKLYQGNCSAAVVGKFESTTFITAANVNFTVCTDPRDPNNFATCANSSIKPTTYRLNPATCGDNCFATKRFCDFVDVGDPTISLITLSFELPVRRDLERWVSAAMLRLHMAGTASATEQSELLDRNPEICAPPPPPTGSLTIQQMSGTYFFGGILIVMGVLLHLVDLLSLSRSDRRRRHAEEEKGHWHSHGVDCHSDVPIDSDEGLARGRQGGGADRDDCGRGCGGEGGAWVQGSKPAGGGGRLAVKLGEGDAGWEPLESQVCVGGGGRALGQKKVTDAGRRGRSGDGGHFGGSSGGGWAAGCGGGPPEDDIIDMTNEDEGSDEVGDSRRRRRRRRRRLGRSGEGLKEQCRNIEAAIVHVLESIKKIAPPPAPLAAAVLSVLGGLPVPMAAPSPPQDSQPMDLTGRTSRHRGGYPGDLREEM